MRICSTPMMLTPEARHVTLTTFGLTEADLLGSGSESRVYALDAARVLRVYNSGASLETYAARLKAFYDTLPPFSFACRTPWRKWMLVAAALIPQRMTRSLSATRSGWHEGVSPMTAFHPASLAGEQIVLSRRDAPRRWKNGWPLFLWMSPIVPA